jgi:hypothetical protein
MSPDLCFVQYLMGDMWLLVSLPRRLSILQSEAKRMF